MWRSTWERDAAFRLYVEGFNVYHIARVIGVSEYTVKYWRTKYYWKARAKAIKKGEPIETKAYEKIKEQTEGLVQLSYDKKTEEGNGSRSPGIPNNPHTAAQQDGSAITSRRGQRNCDKGRSKIPTSVTSDDIIRRRREKKYANEN